MIRDRLSSESCGTIDRTQAATLLQEARNAEGSVANDAIDRAFAQLTDSPGARSLKIKQLINQDDLDEAGAVIAQGLLQRPTNASLTLLRAQVLYAQGKYDDCAHELRLLLLNRPKHFASLVLAGQIAIANDAPLRAASYFMRASSRPLSNRETLKLLANALNEAGQVREARQVLDRIKPRPLYLTATVLRVEGRLLEAADTFEAAAGNSMGSQREAAICLLIAVLEEIGDMPRLKRILEPIDKSTPIALVRAGQAWLWLGAFKTALVRMASLSKVPGFMCPALTIGLVASSMLNRHRLSERILKRLRSGDKPVDNQAMAQAWCCGLMGRLLLAQCDPKQAGADPRTGQLGLLLQDAVKIFDQQLGEHDDSLTATQLAELEHHRTVCQQGLSDLSIEPIGRKKLASTLFEFTSNRPSQAAA